MLLGAPTILIWPTHDPRRDVYGHRTKKEPVKRRYKNRRQGHHAHMQVRINYVQKCTNGNRSRSWLAENRPSGGRITTKSTGDEIARSSYASLD